MESTCTAVYISPNKCTYAREKCLLQGFSGSSRFPTKVDCFLLFLALNLLVGIIIEMAKPRKVVERIFTLIQSFFN